MKPFNAKDRKRAFWKFLGIFTLTILILAIPVIFIFQIPEEECKSVRSMNSNLQAENSSLKDSLRNVKSTISSLQGGNEELRPIWEDLNFIHTDIEEKLDRVGDVLDEDDESHMDAISLFVALRDENRELAAVAEELNNFIEENK
jgi:predicted transcriptional regulator